MGIAVSERARHVVIIVENLPVPFDRRVWQEARALRDAGWQVSVICPKSERHPQTREEFEGISIFRHSLPVQARWKLGFLAEYAMALFHELRLLGTIYFATGFDVVQACNPPDLIFLVVIPFKLVGARFVFDYHDTCPELFVAKFRRKGILYRMLLIAEKLTFRFADIVISANETYREIAIARGGKQPSRVEVVYSVPDWTRIQRALPDPKHTYGGRLTIGYVGIIGDQDGLDHLVHALVHLVRVRKFTNVQAMIVGDGPALPAIKQLANDLSIQSHITFLGYLTGNEFLSAMSSFDIGVMPDPMNEYNDKISMNKVFEYSALGIPSVSYRLNETMRLLGDAGYYALRDDPASLGDALYELLSNVDLRSELSHRAKTLAANRFNWSHEAKKYVDTYERLWEEMR